ncbi:5-bromo-4-chloroindolyl phosphate hydrolysis family protein [Indiicoccus explosivorum]|uniref:5-bromo-4-chloroindolyl phosphate hydrolysis family protein n=1 Tax=Indiicoccus explosivorum TaxID=1917864 RepID=UPI000B44F957|nr:5-bromo-4-chloroindolyl phosphate hydrolysis family protein [Indiicoccus explosivorum]
MKPFENFVVRQTVGLPLMTVMFPVLYLGAEIGFVLSGAAAAGTYIASTGAMKQLQVSNDSKHLGMTRREFKSVKQQLKEAKNKVAQLQNQSFRLRSLTVIKQQIEMTRTANKIISSIQQNPRKFYQAGDFFYSHLDSALELTSKYALLASQPVKDKEMKLALQETREMLSALSQAIQGDLKRVLADDMEQLRVELDYAQLSTSRKERPELSLSDQSNEKGEMRDDSKSAE